ncbi:hypothetical protein Cni_G10845 [Canna indica]|uniref:Uncharacterized protein n=1 Tax=Canna indica TaxID=4628 RepID=A0AAQ3KAM5_9LILI|nr:hypothetical protein Cni_G10845 [Canna indica]
MKTSEFYSSESAQDPQNIEDMQSSSQASNEVHQNHQNTLAAEAPGANSVWKKLEEENSDFFRAYYIRLKLKRQIILFNHLLEHQCHLMKSPLLPNIPLAPLHNGIQTTPVNNMPMGYPVLQQPAMTATGQPHFDPTGCGLSSCHVVNGIPPHGRFHALSINSGNEIVMGGATTEAAPVGIPCGTISSMSEMAASPASVASNNHFPFTPPEISGMCLDASTLDTTLTSDMVSTGDLQLDQECAMGSSRDPLGSLGQLWNLNLSDLTTDLASLGDLRALDDYTGSPFPPPDSDILLDSPEQDDKVEEYFADALTVAASQPDDEKP